MEGEYFARVIKEDEIFLDDAASRWYCGVNQSCCFTAYYLLVTDPKRYTSSLIYRFIC